MSVSAYTGTLPNPRTQGASDLTTNMQAFITWFVANAPEVAGHVAELVALASVAAWSDSTTYALYDTVYGADGHTYRCITACTDVEPGVDSGWETYWKRLTLDSPVLTENAKSAGFTAETNTYLYTLTHSTTITITLPATGLYEGDTIEFVNTSGVGHAITFTCSGVNISGSSSDDTMMSPNNWHLTARYITTYGWCLTVEDEI